MSGKNISIQADIPQQPQKGLEAIWSRVTGQGKKQRETIRVELAVIKNQTAQEKRTLLQNQLIERR